MKLLLINRNHPIPQHYKPILKEVCEGFFLDADAASAMKKMLCAALSCRVHLRVFSAYRSISYQKGLFNEDVERNILSGLSYEEAYLKTTQSIALPGQSEHNAGIAADISSRDWRGEIDESFEDTPEFRWLEENAHCFGYILRYPRGKTGITGIAYEPWHYRYVGEFHAENIRRMGITLEEYLMLQNDKCVTGE